MGTNQSSLLTENEWLTIHRKQLSFSYDYSTFWVEEGFIFKRDGKLSIFVDGKLFAQKTIPDYRDDIVPIFSGNKPMTEGEFRHFRPKVSNVEYKMVPYLIPGFFYGLIEEQKEFYIFYDEFGNKYSILGSLHKA